MRVAGLALLIAFGAGTPAAIAQTAAPSATAPGKVLVAPKAPAAPKATPQTGQTTGSVSAATPNVRIPSPVLVIDPNRLFTGSEYGQRVQKDLDARARALGAQNRKIEAQLSAEEKKLTAERKTMSPQAFRKLADAFDAKVQAIRKDRRTKTSELDQARQTARDTFLKKVVPILGSVMRENGAVAILNRQTVFLSYHGIDVTDRAIAAINAKLGDGSQPAAKAPGTGQAATGTGK